MPAKPSVAALPAQRRLQNVVRELKEQCSVGCFYCTVTVESDGIEHHESDCIVTTLSGIAAELEAALAAAPPAEAAPTVERLSYGSTLIRDPLASSALLALAAELRAAIDLADEGDWRETWVDRSHIVEWAAKLDALAGGK